MIALTLALPLRAVTNRCAALLDSAAGRFPRRRSTRLRLATVTAGLALLVAPTARADTQDSADATADKPSRAVELLLQQRENTPAEFDESLAPEDTTHIFNDKEEIAREKHRALEGLRAQGNAHVPRGGILSRIVDDPERRQVDLEALRAERIRAIETRRPVARAPRASSTEAVPARAATRASEVAAQRSTGPGGSGSDDVSDWLAAACVCLTLVGGGLWLVMR